MTHKVITKEIIHQCLADAITDGRRSDTEFKEYWRGQRAAYETLLKYFQDEQPVPWPTEPGWWWMDAKRIAGMQLVECFGDNLQILNASSMNRGTAASVGARFLPAHIPTFPPREKD